MKNECGISSNWNTTQTNEEKASDACSNMDFAERGMPDRKGCMLYKSLHKYLRKDTCSK